MHDIARKQILIADDDTSVLSYYRSIFSAMKDESCDDRIAQELGDLVELTGSTIEEAPPATAEEFDYFVATGGMEAIEIQREHLQQGVKPTHAFLDIRMPPGIDGLETAELLLKENPDLVVTFVSAYSKYSEEAIAERMQGNYRVIRKPFKQEDLLEVLG